MAKKRQRSGETTAEKAPAAPKFTAKQGQYLAYIHWYRKLHRTAPAESEIAKFFGVTPPSAHLMVVRLEELGLLTREPGTARSLRVTVPESELPPFGAAETPESPPEERPEKTSKKGKRRTAGTSQTHLYTLQVFLIGGPTPKRFEGKEVSRIIQIRGDQTLEDLHDAIFNAFDRWDEHFYEFQFGQGPHDPDGPRYVLPPMLAEVSDEASVTGDVTETTIDSLGLELEQAFGYWFDYGDDWWHQINVLAREDKIPAGKFPKIIERVGQSPPQYLDEDEEE